MSGRLRLTIRDRIAWLVIDHPERRNAITAPMYRALPEQLARLEAEERVGALVLRGAGETIFASGADTSEFLGDARYASTTDQPPEIVRAHRALEGFGKPIVAMIHGACIGGGLVIALRADLRFADDRATFAVPAARLGIGYPAVEVERLQAIVGPAFAKEMLFTGRRVEAGEASRWGLANAILPTSQLEQYVNRVGQEIVDAGLPARCSAASQP